MLLCLLKFLRSFSIRKSSVAALVLLTTMSIFEPVGLLRAAPPDDSADSSTVAIIYDSKQNPQLDSYIHALFLANLLTHFKLQAALIPIDDYKRGQLAQYRAGFMVASGEKTVIPAAVLADIRATDHPFAWLGNHIDQLLATPEARGHYGFSFVEYRHDLDYRSVFYKQTMLPKPEPDLNVVSIDDPGTAEIEATAINGNKTSSPYVVKSGDFWFFADKPFSYMGEGSRYLVLCDLLHDILGIYHPSDQRAMVRIEDVSVDDDPGDLISIANWLSDRHIPFQIALIPIFRDPAHSLEIRLGDRKSTVAAIHTMIAEGGTPVMHGITHQVHGLSGDEYEFWDELGNRAVGGDSADFVTRRLKMGFAECFNNGIYPVAFEVPHYGASATDYRTLGQVFNQFYDRPMVTPDDTTAQLIPYPASDQYGRHIIPETLGYLPEDDPDPLKIVEYARTMRVVRDGIASFYFHPFLNQKLLEQAIMGISALGYHFISLRDFDDTVDFDGQYAVRTTSGKIDLSPKNEYWRMQLFNASGQVVKTDLSAGRANGPVELPAEVPSGGWAEAEVMNEPPAATEHANSWWQRITQWWDSLHPVAPPPSTIVRDKFAGPPTAWILWLENPHVAAGHNQQSYKTVLEALGYQVKIVNALKLRETPGTTDTLLIVPHAAGMKLTEGQRNLVIRYLATGGNVVADGSQPWLSKIGIVFTGFQNIVSGVTDPDYTDVKLTWRPEEHIARFTPPQNIRELMDDSESGQPVAFSGSFGAGHYIYLAAQLDNFTNEGTSHYPYFPEYLSTTFGATTSLRSRHIEVYFDPDSRPGADFNRLATIWHRAGITTVHVAAWKFTRLYAFPYDDFVKACHRSGITVYAWFWYPMVSFKMWDDHPEWREKTATGADGKVGAWGREPMNFQDPDCFQAAMDWTKVLLNASDWDGIDISELNFDADFKDYLRPDSFVPMNDIVRADFKKKAGFDPIQLFKPNSPHYYKTDPAGMMKFQRYREDIVVDWHRRVLTELGPLCKQRGLEVIVTMFDSLQYDTVRLAQGVDSRRITGLMREFPFTLNVEDPARFWMTSPERYRRFADAYRKLVPDPQNRLMFDVNVVADRDITNTNLPSKTATGTELALTILSAASVSGRAVVYSEFTVSPQDWDLIQMVLNRPTAVSGGKTGMDVDARTSLVLTPADDPLYYVDGHPWPAVSSDGVVMPTGAHSVSTEQSWWHFLDTNSFQARILSTSADLADAHADTTGLTFSYHDPLRSVFIFNQEPNDILVDGSSTALPTDRNGNDWAVVFPSGDHNVRVATNTKAGVAVDVVGWASSWAIWAFGLLATVLMVVIYLQVRLARLIKRNG